MALLLAAGVDDRLEICGKPIAAFAVTSQRCLAPEDEGTELLLSVVVGRLDAFLRDEAPEGLAVVEDVRARAADDSQVRASAKQELDGVPRGDGVLPEGLASDAAIACAVPLVHEVLRATEQAESKLPRFAALLRVPGELPDEMALMPCSA